jgi:hypothetical protein
MEVLSNLDSRRPRFYMLLAVHAVGTSPRRMFAKPPWGCFLG